MRNPNFIRPVGAPHKRGKRAVGCRHPARNGLFIQVCFQDDVFAEMAKRALAKDISFAELVRTYCEWGLENDA